VALGLRNDVSVAAENTNSTRPNIILCMTDDQGWADVSYNEAGRLVNGKFKTTELDKMAAAGLRFDRFYAAASVCSPTRASCLTGRHPFRYGVTLFGKPLDLREKTIAQALKAAGYRTGHFGKWHLNGLMGPGQPIAKDDPLNPGAFGFDTWFSVSNYFENDWTFGREGTPVATQGDGSDVIVAEAIKWLDSLETKASGQPFFAVIWFGSPYDNKPLKGEKGGLYEGGIRVPGICEWPARVKPGRTAVPVVTSDFYPTILEAAGVALPKDNPQPIDGISLIPLLDGKMNERPSPIGFMDAKSTALSDNRYNHALVSSL
jgi:arylsulfatase A-like enzyme